MIDEVNEMDKPKIYITRKIPSYLIEPFLDQLQFKMWLEEDTPVPVDVLRNEIKEVDGLLCLLTDQIDQKCLKKANRLKIIANMAVGYDNIDASFAHSKNIIVTNTPDVLTETTADLTFALLMATARRLEEAMDYIRKNKWRDWAPFMLAGTDIYHKTIGIVGMGRIGEAVAKRAKGFNMNIIYHNRSRKAEFETAVEAEYKEFDELIEASDFVVSLLPLTEETKGKFNKEIFHKMKKTAIFINASRGGVVNETDLYEALVEGEIQAAGLDVFASEPIKNDHPLATLKNVVALPHIGSASVDTREKMIDLCFKNIDAVLSGENPLTEI